MVTKSDVRYEQRMSQEHQQELAMRRALELVNDQSWQEADAEMVETVQRDGIGPHILTDEDIDRILA